MLWLKALVVHLRKFQEHKFFQNVYYKLLHQKNYFPTTLLKHSYQNMQSCDLSFHTN